MTRIQKIFFAVTTLICLSANGGSIFAFDETRPRVNYKETVLKNGLRVITVEDRSAPIITTNVIYNVGSRDERPGLTGFAHLFEHMMFKGSENVGRGEHFYQVFTNGGFMNGITNPDRTFYYETMPSNQLETALFLEADRMRSLAITKENLDNQRLAVQEERRQFVDNAPYGKAEEATQNLLYDNFAYQHVTIGSMEDLNRASVEDVAKFFKTYYAPNNATLTVVGDFDRKNLMALIDKYFAEIPRQPAPPAIDMTEPEQKEERRRTIASPLAQAAQVRLAFKAVPGGTDDFYALSVLSSALQSGQSSRLLQKLVKEKELVTGIGGFMDERRGTSALYVIASVRPGKNPADVEAAIYEEINQIIENSISDAELQKIKNGIRRDYINGLRSTTNRALLLNIYALYYNDPNLINTRLDKFNAVTKEDVQRVAGKYLKPENRTVVVTVPQNAPKK